MSLIPAGSVRRVSWSEIDKAQTVKWAPMPPQEMPSPPWSDTENHFYRGGQADLGGRVLYLTATGTKDGVRNVHARRPGDAGESWRRAQGPAAEGLRRAAGALRKAVPAVRREMVPGDGAREAPVMLHAQVRCDTIACPKGQENYTLALDGVLPKLKAGEVEAVGGRCPGR